MMSTRISAAVGGLLVLWHCSACWAEAGKHNAGPAVELYGLRLPDGQDAIRQGSGLEYGRLGEREGLWLVCDRNGDRSSNQVFFIGAETLAKARPGGNVVVDDAIRVRPPGEGWESFGKRHALVGPQRLAELRRQVESDPGGNDAVLDLEGVAIGQAVGGAERRLFVVAEQPDSLVLELQLEDRSQRTEAVIKACYAYQEVAEAQGGDMNDGLEGISWTGKPGEFLLVEEGTKPHRAADTLHYWHSPRLVRATLRDGRVIVDQTWSDELTRKLWSLQKRKTHTLNAVTCLDGRRALAVDRNGGWIMAIDVTDRSIRPWLNIYDPKLLNLRERLADFPGPRRMPYVSMEGIVRDGRGDLWMVDDPAMPEPFRESSLVRLRNPPWGTRRASPAAE